MTDAPQRFEAASLAALFGAVLLLVSPFLTWFDPGGSAWSLLELADLVLIVLALDVGVAATTRLLELRGAASRRRVPIAGAVALLIVLATMVEPPPVAVDADLGFGAWLALLGSVVILAAGVLDLASVSVTVRVGDHGGEGPTVREPEPEPARWAPPVAEPPAGTPARPAAGPAPTEAPPSRTPSLLRPQPPPPERTPEGD